MNTVKAMLRLSCRDYDLIERADKRDLTAGVLGIREDMGFDDFVQDVVVPMNEIITVSNAKAGTGVAFVEELDEE